LADPGRSPFFRLAERAQQNLGAASHDVEVRRPMIASGNILIVEQPLKR
jgi:hypothetical protein